MLGMSGASMGVGRLMMDATRSGDQHSDLRWQAALGLCPTATELLGLESGIRTAIRCDPIHSRSTDTNEFSAVALVGFELWLRQEPNSLSSAIQDLPRIDIVPPRIERARVILEGDGIIGARLEI